MQNFIMWQVWVILKIYEYMRLRKSILVICQEIFEKDFDMFFLKRVTLINLRCILNKNRKSVRLDIIFGVQLFAGVQLVFDQQSKNESYKFTRCKRECSFVLMFVCFSIFSGIIVSIFSAVLSDAVCSFTKIVAEIGISSLWHFVILGSKISRISFRPVKTGIFSKCIGWMECSYITYFWQDSGSLSSLA